MRWPRFKGALQTVASVLALFCPPTTLKVLQFPEASARCAYPLRMMSCSAWGTRLNLGCSLEYQNQKEERKHQAPLPPSES